MRPHAILLAAILVPACGTPAPNVRPDTAFVPDVGDALVMGKISSSKGQTQKALRYHVELVRMSDAKVFFVDPDEQSELQGIWGAQFFVRLPPGKYRIGKWQIDDLANRSWRGSGARLSFTVGRGEAACIGHLFLLADSAYDVCPAIIPLFKDRMPPLADVQLRPTTRF
jgi:hypothetical protein